MARELGSERRETVRSLSIVGVLNLRGSDTSTRGPCWTDLWFTGCAARCIAGGVFVNHRDGIARIVGRHGGLATLHLVKDLVHDVGLHDVLLGLQPVSYTHLLYIVDVNSVTGVYVEIISV